MEFKFKWKNLTRSDVIQYDGEKFVNVPVYTIKTRVEWAFNDINSAKLKIDNDDYLISIPGHKHIIDDVEGLREALNNTGSNVDIDLSNYVTILSFNNHINNQGSAKHLTQEQLNKLNNIDSFWQLDEQGNLYTTYNTYSTQELSAYGLGSGGSGGDGTFVEWGTQFTTFAVELTVEGVKKTLSLSSHTHDVYSITGLVDALNNKQDKLTAGTGITISGNVISAAGGGGSNVSWGTTSNNTSPLTVEGTTKTVVLSGHTHAWSEITGKPSTFTPSSHTHSYGDINSITGSRILGRYSTTTGVAQLISIGSNLSLNSSTGVLSATDTIYTHPTSGVTAGTYKSVTVNNLGHVTSGTNPTTLSGYGITDAVPSNRTVTAGNGMTGGGALSSNITLTLATPSSITLSSTNSVATSSHTHNLSLGGTSSQYLNGATSLVTIPTITAGNGMTGGGQLTADRTLTLGTPSTLTTSTINSVTASSHTHSITTTSVGASNTIVATDANGAVRGNSIKIGADWSFELSGTELQIKRGGTLTHRLLADGSIVGLGEVTAYGAGTGGDGVALLKTGGTMTGTLILDTGANLGASNRALNLLGNSFRYNSSNVLTEANTASKITMGNGWTIEQTTASLTIRRNGVVKGTFNA